MKTVSEKNKKKRIIWVLATKVLNLKSYKKMYFLKSTKGKKSIETVLI